MSIFETGWIWELRLPYAEKYVLLAMANMADSKGNNVEASIQEFAIVTGYCNRQVQRIILSLLGAGLIVRASVNPGKRTIYNIKKDKS